MSEGLEIFSKHYENIFIFDDFDATSENSDVINFINDHCLTNLVKNPICFKSTNSTKIDRFLFEQTHSFETVIITISSLLCLKLHLKDSHTK